MKAAVIVPCAGQGQRLGGSVAKQFMTLGNKPILAYTLECLEKHPRIERIILAVPKDWVQRVQTEVLQPYSFLKVTNVVVGGATRQASVAQGLAVLEQWQGPVLIHDGVRPLLEAEVIDRVIESVQKYGSGVAALPVTDTIKKADSQGWVQSTLPRQDLWQIQTPQGFWLKELQLAYAAAEQRGIQATDDAALLEALGKPVRLVKGDIWNIKITYPQDIGLMKARLYQCDKLGLEK